MSKSDERTLLLLRHAKAEAPWGMSDADRGLTKHGGEQARDVGEYLASESLVPDGVLVSDSRRTRATYAWIASILGEEAPSAYLDSRLYESPAAAMIAVINETPTTVRSLLVVGHLPAVQDAAMRLSSADSDEDAVLDMAGGFPPAGLCVFKVPGEWEELDGRDARLERFITVG
ncbi:MAG: SixA phosphatase family protein [Galactobacter sp.]